MSNLEISRKLEKLITNIVGGRECTSWGLNIHSNRTPKRDTQRSTANRNYSSLSRLIYRVLG